MRRGRPFRWRCPMCARIVRESTAIGVLEDETQVCNQCWTRTRGRKTMSFGEFKRLCAVNSNKVPVVEIGGRRNRWMGFGVCDDGPATGKEVLITP